MAYRRSLAGVQSQPSGGRVASSALGDTRLVKGPPGPHWYKALQGVPLGGDGTDLTEAEFRQMSLREQTIIRETIEKATKHADLFRALSIAATLSIPLAAWVWRGILGRRKASTSP